MKLAKRTELHVVEREPLGPGQMLRIVMPDLIEAERVVARLKQIVADQGRKLAEERGVRFIREEHLRREFAE